MKCEVCSASPENIAKAVGLLKAGQLVGMPTETVYGLAADIRNPEALAQVFAVKSRPRFDPLIVHVVPEKTENALNELSRKKIIQIDGLSSSQQALVQDLIEEYWPGPLTLVLPKHPELSDLISGGLPTVGVRMPAHPVAQDLIKAMGSPLAAPSANRFGRISPTRPQDVVEELGKKILMVIDGGPCLVGIESTVLGFDEKSKALAIFRHGKITQEDLVDFSRVTVLDAKNVKEVLAPGMSKSHYAPATPFILLEKAIEEFSQLPGNVKANQKVGLITMKDKDLSTPFNQVSSLFHKSLSQSGDLSEIACNLFATLRAMDQRDLEVILCEPCPDTEGLGFAIQDRLERAAAQ